jgi:amphi-Trp domain-containing protein
MGNERVIMQSEEKRSSAEVAVFLRNLADQLEQQRIVLRHGSEELVLELPNEVTLEIKVEEELEASTTEKSFELELEWVEGEDGTDKGIRLA